MTDGVGLEDAYGATLDRINGQGGEKARLGMAALMWISHSERPLSADELCHSLAVKIGSLNLDAGHVPSTGTLLACCQGLVAVEKETSTVRFIHFTVQEFLRAHPEFFSSAHSTIAETCLSYLNSEQVKALSAPNPDLQNTPFFEYSSLHWGTHARRELSNCAKLLAPKLFDDYQNHVSIKFLLQAHRYRIDFDQLSLFSGLHCASFFGIVEIVACLVEIEGYDVNQEDCIGNTPLLWAAENGHEGVVEALLRRRDINPEKADAFGRTPLWNASRYGHEGVVKELVRRDDIDPDTPDRFDQTPLWCAAGNGQEGVVKILLERDEVDPDKPNDYGVTPLWEAACRGYEGIVRILLERDDVDPDKPNNNSDGPLWGAALSGQEGVVRILLERDDVNPDRPGGGGETPLFAAAWEGREEVVRILLERDDVHPDKPNDDGKTPLWAAAHRGHESVVRMLLGRNDVNPHRPDKSGRTPSWYV